LNSVRDARQLAQLYRKAAEVLDQQPERRADAAKIWGLISQLQRGPLKDSAAAIRSLQTSLALDPGVASHRVELAELLETAGAYRASARQIHALVKTVHSRPQVAALARDLHHLYSQAGEVDWAWCCLSVRACIETLDVGSVVEVQKGAPKAPALARRRLNAADWQNVLIHPLESRMSVIGEIFQVCSIEIARAWSRTPDASFAIADPGGEFVAGLCQQTIETMNVPAPIMQFKRVPNRDVELFLVEDKRGPIPHLRINPDLDQSEPMELAFLLAVKLSVLRSNLPLFLACDPTMERLRQAYADVLALAGAGSPRSGGDLHTPGLAAVSGARLDRLRTLVQRRPAPTLVDDWAQGVAHTAVRVGLLVCGDIVAAVRLLRRGKHPYTEAIIDDLVRWALSEEYLTLRRSLGLSSKSEGR
jgi:hypothetical protein